MSDLFSRGSAVISPCGQYRYRLERKRPGAVLTAAVIMVNPSIADAEADDATIRKVTGFCNRHGYYRFIVGNKFAFRATDIKDLRNFDDPVGPENDEHLATIMMDAEIVIVAWGTLAKLPQHLRSRWKTVFEIARAVDQELWCLGTGRDGHPNHPLMLAYDTPLVRWDPPSWRPPE